MKVFSDEILARAARECNVADLANCTIGEMVLVAGWLEARTGEKIIHMEQGVPGLPANASGVNAEKKALDAGVGNAYPPAGGVRELREAASRFIKAFIDVDVAPDSCIATVGSVAASFGAFVACTQRIPGKNKVLFFDPGFPIQKSQLKIFGADYVAFDIAGWRGAEALGGKLEELLASGDIAALIYSNPNNPAWTCLEEEELEVIGRLATKYDVVVMEDLAYFGMDFRRDLGKPYEAPYLPTVARYTDNYILMLSASKIFSYAGQRIGLCCVSDALFGRRFPALAERYADSGVFGSTLTASILYMITSGCTASTQYAYAEMLNLACEGKIDFVSDTREYERRARKMKDIFTNAGFRVTYDRDVTAPVGDGFFFTLSYGAMTSGELLLALLSYGICGISLSTTGADRHGIRACVSRMNDESLFTLLASRVSQFAEDFPAA